MKRTLEKILDRVMFRLKLEQVPERVYRELDYFNQKGEVRQLLFLSDLVRYLKANNVYVGIGSGIHTCSLVCYGLGLTDVNPLKWNLPFEVFIENFRSLWLTTSKGGFDKAVEFVNAQSLLPVNVAKDKHRFYGEILLEGQEAFNLRFSLYEYDILDICKEIERRYNQNPMKIKMNEQILDIFRYADTDDVWQFSPDGMKDLLLRFRPECFSDLYLLDALYAPAHNKDMVSEIMRRKRENDIPSTGIAAIDSILMESYGMLVYKEQEVLIRQYFMCAEEESFSAESIRRIIANRPIHLRPKGVMIAQTMGAVASAYYKLKKNGAKNYPYSDADLEL